MHHTGVTRAFLRVEHLSMTNDHLLASHHLLLLLQPARP
jgi:hypothetical protein